MEEMETRVHVKGTEKTGGRVARVPAGALQRASAGEVGLWPTEQHGVKIGVPVWAAVTEYRGLGRIPGKPLSHSSETRAPARWHSGEGPFQVAAGCPLPVSSLPGARRLPGAPRPNTALRRRVAACDLEGRVSRQPVTVLVNKGVICKIFPAAWKLSSATIGVQWLPRAREPRPDITSVQENRRKPDPEERRLSF